MNRGMEPEHDEERPEVEGPAVSGEKSDRGHPARTERVVWAMIVVALCGVIALLVRHIRQAPPAARPPEVAAGEAPKPAVEPSSRSGEPPAPRQPAAPVTAARPHRRGFVLPDPDAVPQVEVSEEEYQRIVDRYALEVNEGGPRVGRKAYEGSLGQIRSLIERYPDAQDIDYCYGWGLLRACKAREYEEALKYYAILRVNFYGKVSTGRITRSWEDKIQRTRLIIQNDPDLGPERAEYLARMDKLDAIGHMRHKRTTDAAGATGEEAP